jgi:hypothetical protein
VKPGAGKQKGASFEREVCVLLSKWISSGQQEDIFWRSAMSGGRATVAHKSGKRLASQAGDISCIDPKGQHFMSHFAVECKHYADLDYRGILTGKGKLLSFWYEIKTQAGRYSKYPFLVARQNRMPAYVALGKKGLRRLGLSDAHTVLISIQYDLYLIELEKFLAVCPPYHLRTSNASY